MLLARGAQPAARSRGRWSSAPTRATSPWRSSTSEPPVSCAAPRWAIRRGPQRVVIDVGGSPVDAIVLRVGNPQCVVLEPALDQARYRRLGAALEHHPFFPDGTNVEFAVVERPDLVRILIWERGVGPTMASGTGACAAAVAAMAFGGAARDVNVASPGGEQRVEWRADGLYLTGWAEVVWEGRWTR